MGYICEASLGCEEVRAHFTCLHGDAKEVALLADAAQKNVPSIATVKENNNATENLLPSLCAFSFYFSSTNGQLVKKTRK